MPNSLQGLNIVYPASRPTAADDLLSPPPDLPDLTAELDLWTHLSFASDEPLIATHRKDPIPQSADPHPNLPEVEETKEMNQTFQHGLITNPDKQLQLSIPEAPSVISSDHPPSSQTHETPGSFDLNSFLAGFGIDPFVVPPQPDSSLSSLSQPSLSSLSTPSDISRHSISQLDGDTQPPSKRSRPRKNSITSHTPTIVPATLKHAEASSTRAVSEFSDDHDPLSTPLTAAEDKRRRNTAASARFRAKKKEREHALEKRSKALETRVNELERECEGLRRENGWLKGLVVGVTGSNLSSVPNVLADEPAGQDGGKKRKRDTDSVAQGS
jgi:Basic region leucine zipper